MVYVRKISEDSWFYKPVLDADAISELSTQNHDLSVWKIDDISDKKKLDDIALALALSRDSVDEFYMVFLDLEKINSKYHWTIEFHEQDGDTGFTEMVKEHTNFILLSFWHQGFLAEHINELIQDKVNYIYYDVVTLVALLNEAIKSNRIDRKLIKSRFGKWNKKLKELEEIE